MAVWLGHAASPYPLHPVAVHYKGTVHSGPTSSGFLPDGARLLHLEPTGQNSLAH
jgi:hypothetical protein